MNLNLTQERLEGGTMAHRAIPRMRTAPKIVAEIKALDPGSEVTEYYIRQIVKEGIVPVVWAGNKALINLDDVLALLRLGTERTEPVPHTVNGIRQVNVKRPILSGERRNA